MSCLELQRAKFEIASPGDNKHLNNCNDTKILLSMLNCRDRRVEGRKGYADAYEEPVRTAVERGGLEGRVSAKSQDAGSHRYGLL